MVPENDSRGPLPRAAAPPAIWIAIAWILVAVPWAIVLGNASVVIDGERIFWLDDDQMISMRYARNLAEGLGPVWNPGERVEGYTNPAWMVTMAAVHLLPVSDGNASVLVKIIALGLGLWVLVLAARLVHQLEPRPGAALPALLLGLALTLDFTYFLANGFETTMLMAAFLFAVLGVIRDTPAGSARASTYLALALVPLVRSDAHALWLAVALLDLGLARDRGRRVFYLGLAALPAIGHELFRIVYYDSLFPNTYYLKVEGIPGLFRAGLGYAWRFFRHYGLFLLVAGVGAWKLRDRRYLLLALGLGLHLVAVVQVGGDLFPYSRFLAPWVPVLIAAAVAVPVRMDLSVRLRAVILAILAGSLLLQVSSFRPRTLTSDNGWPEAGAVTGRLIERYTAPDASVGVLAAGTVSYFSRRPVIDMLGKSDARIAHAPPGAPSPRGHDKFDFDYVLSRRPDLIAAFFRHESVELHRQGRTPPGAHLPYLEALSRHPVFVEDYLPNRVELPSLENLSALYVDGRSPEAARLDGWRDPVIER